MPIIVSVPVIEKKNCYKVEKKVWEKVCVAEKKVIVDDTFNYV